MAPNQLSLVQQIAEHGSQAETVAKQIEAVRQDSAATEKLVSELQASIGRVRTFLAAVVLSPQGKEGWERKIRHCEEVVAALGVNGQE